MGAGPLVWLLLWAFYGSTIASENSVSAYTLLMVVIVYPVLEEIVFRGALQGWLLSYGMLTAAIVPGITIANVLASAVFALFHLVNQSPGWAILIFFPSLVFGWARDRYGFLTASILLHSFYNAGFYLLFK